jgi:hypothetical protein
MEFSHWFAGFCMGGIVALIWHTYEQRRTHREWMELFERMGMDATYFPDDDEEEYDDSEAWKYN